MINVNEIRKEVIKMKQVEYSILKMLNHVATNDGLNETIYLVPSTYRDEGWVARNSNIHDWTLYLEVSKDEIDYLFFSEEDKLQERFNQNLSLEFYNTHGIESIKIKRETTRFIKENKKLSTFVMPLIKLEIEFIEGGN